CHLAGACDPATGSCAAGPPQPDGTSCADGNSCTTGDSCQSGVCAGAPLACAPVDQCHLAGVCDPATGSCSAGAPRPDGTSCSDGNSCTLADTCLSGICTGSPVACAPLDQCHLPGVCDPATGSCSAGPPQPDGTACGDGNSCT